MDAPIDSSGPKLVRSALATQRVNSAHITGAIAHFKDDPGALSPFLDEDVFDRLVPLEVAEEGTLECFSIASYGVGFVAFAALKPAGAGEAPHRSVEMTTSSVTRERLGRLPSRSRLRPGTVVSELQATRPSRLGYSDTTVTEFLVKLPPPLAARPSGLRAAATRIAEWVWEERHALTFIHWPGSPPAVEGAWRTAEGPCIRFGVATPRHDVPTRLAFGRTVLERCVALGYGLWIRQSGEPAGAYDYWRCLFSPDPGAERRPEPDWRPARVPYLAVTCVGPAHRGTTAAILRVLDEAGVPVPTFSVATLDDLSFVHFVADAPPGAASIAPGQPAATALWRLFGLEEPAEGTDLRLEGFRIMATPFPAPPPAWPLAGGPTGSGGPGGGNGSPRARRTRRTGGSGRDKQSLWMAWSTPARHNALSLVVKSARTALTGALEAHTPGAAKPSIEYLICRTVSVDQLRGRAKITLDLESVAPPGSAIGDTAWLGRFCSEIESRWRADLSFTLGTPRVDLEVVWRESWLGRWSLLQRGELR